MSIRTLLMPVISQHLLARERLLKLRARAERERLAGARPHQLHYFHQVDDPYSALLAGILPQLIARYDIDVVPHVVGPPPDSAAPEREKLIAYSRKDARLLARHWNLVFDDLIGQPQDQSVEAATRLLVAAVQDGTFIEAAGEISTCLWSDPPSLFFMRRSGGPLRALDPSAVSSHVAASNALRQQLGHYLGATFFYAGEWYWGIDRLHHLERRLQDLGAQRLGVQDLMFPPDADLSGPVSLASPLPIDFFFSFRSPYSAIVAPRVFELGRRTGAPVRTSISPSGPAGVQKLQVVGTADSRKCFWRSPGSSGSIHPCTFTFCWCRASTGAGNCGTIFFFSTRVVTADSRFHDSTPSRSSSGLKALRGSWYPGP